MKSPLPSPAILLFAAASFLPITAFAQGVRIGPRFGVNLATTNYVFTDKEYQKEYRSMIEPRIAMQAGLAFHFPLSKSFFLQPEILYASQGYKFNRTEYHPMLDNYFYTNYKHELRSNYLQLPVLIGYKFGGENVHFFVKGGLYGGYWLNGKLTTRGHTNRVDFYADNITKPGFRRFDAGVIGSIGIGFKIEEEIFAVDFRYLEGLTPFQKYEFGFGQNGGDVTYKNRVYSIGASYLLGKAKPAANE